MDLDRIRLILNIAFMIGALTSVVLFFVMPSDKPMPMFIVCTTAIVLKFVEYALRMSQNATNRKKREKR